MGAQTLMKHGIRFVRRIERSCGQAPTTQMGIRGRWTGGGWNVIGPKR